MFNYNHCTIINVINLATYTICFLTISIRTKYLLGRNTILFIFISVS